MEEGGGGEWSWRSIGVFGLDQAGEKGSRGGEREERGAGRAGGGKAGKEPIPVSRVSHPCSTLFFPLSPCPLCLLLRVLIVDSTRKGDALRR